MVQPDEFEVWYKTEDFPDSFLPTGRMVFTVDALAHALFVTGRAPQDQAVFGWTSVYEWLHRVALIPAYIRRAPTGRLTLSDLAQRVRRARQGRVDVVELLDTHLAAVRPANQFMDGTVVTSKWQQALDQDGWSTDSGENYPQWW